VVGKSDREFYEKYSDIKVEPGEIVIVPWDNRLMEMPPYINSQAPAPTWLKAAAQNEGSIRRCAATIDVVTAGITLPAWTNFRFHLSERKDDWIVRMDQFDEMVQGSRPKFMNQPFSFIQTGECPMTDVRAIKQATYPKLVNPWRFITAPGWSCLILPVMHQPNKNWTLLPGIVHTDFYHEMNCVLNITATENFSIQWGEPMAQIIPFRRDSDFKKIRFADESAYHAIIGRGFGSGSLKPGSSDQSSSRLYRALRLKLDREIEPFSPPKKRFRLWK